MTIFPTLHEFVRHPGPIALERPAGNLTPADAYTRLRREDPGGPVVLLESASGSEQIGRYSFIALRPVLTLTATGRTVLVETPSGRRTTGDHPLTLLRRLLRSASSSASGGSDGGWTCPRPKGLPPFFAGFIGYLGYEASRWALPVGSRRAQASGLAAPDLVMWLATTVVAFDHTEGRLFLIRTPLADDPSAGAWLHRQRGRLEAVYETAVADLHNLAAHLNTAPPPVSRGSGPLVQMAATMSREAYIQMVRRAQTYIAAGDIYQANLSLRLEGEASGLDPWQLYMRLRVLNPSPFAAYCDTGSLQLVSCSPERLVKLEGGLIEARPIAGTRPRGQTPAEDQRLVEELMAHPKERAEHLMLVDLARNDVGRVARRGSVAVHELMTVETYSHVHHLVSNVTGALESGLDAVDLLTALFPGGTITGVPKVRCLEIISELEPTGRGPYTGSLGYISLAGDADFNILIRTAVVAEGQVTVQAGSGIVADSDPAREYAESLAKAQALLDALHSV